jgi:hypothetical protein
MSSPGFSAAASAYRSSLHYATASLGTVAGDPVLGHTPTESGLQPYWGGGGSGSGGFGGGLGCKTTFTLYPDHCASKSTTTCAGITVTRWTSSCSSKETCCNGVCKDVTTDVQNCGACGNVCPTGCMGETPQCSNGSCLPRSFSYGEYFPTKAYGDSVLRWEVFHDRLPGNPDYLDCQDVIVAAASVTEAETCLLSRPGCYSNLLPGYVHLCQFIPGGCPLPCQPGLKDCLGTCADLLKDPSHCGHCWASCRAGEVCSNGECCPLGQLHCAGIRDCVNLQTDPAHCGTCGNACLAGSVCCNGHCCVSGATCCNGTCVDTVTDRKHCGSCGSACTPHEWCSNGLCCNISESNCGGTCINLSSEHDNCGACGNKCEGNDVCANARCSDPCDVCFNCHDTWVGWCFCNGNNCGWSSKCCASAPAPGTTCPSGQVDCGAGCTNMQSDPLNCGMCGSVCTASGFSRGKCQSKSCGIPYRYRYYCSGSTYSFDECAFPDELDQAKQDAKWRCGSDVDGPHLVPGTADCSYNN